MQLPHLFCVFQLPQHAVAPWPYGQPLLPLSMYGRDGEIEQIQKYNVYLELLASVRRLKGYRKGQMCVNLGINLPLLDELLLI